MAFLKLIQLHCNQTEDFSGPDEAYLKGNGAVIFGPMQINNGQTLSLTSVPLIPFSGDFSLELFDQDTGVFDPDDLLGGLLVQGTDAGMGVRTGTISGVGPSYVLTYEVRH